MDDFSIEVLQIAKKVKQKQSRDLGAGKHPGDIDRAAIAERCIRQLEASIKILEESNGIFARQITA